MGSKIQKRLALSVALLAAMLPASAQQAEQSDSLVRFVKGTSIQLIEKYGETFRKAVDATFLHNGTYLICDTALWDVNRKVINAEGNVRIIQEETTLTSDRLEYLIDEAVAQFRGTLVQLRDKDNNTLRTRHLDYSTRDSSAVFMRGGSMKDKDGQIIESLEGSYSSRDKRFSFHRQVNMFTDSVFVRTEDLEYDTRDSKAHFISAIDFWKDGNMLSSESGWYDRSSETFFFKGGVHALTRDQETWSDSLYFYRASNNVKLLGNAQVQDSTRKVAALADYIYYEDSLSRVTLKDNAAVAMRTVAKAGEGEGAEEKADTLYFGADTLVYYTVRRCDIPETLSSEASARLGEMFVDPVTEYRLKAAREAAARAESDRNSAAGPGKNPPAALSGGKRSGRKADLNPDIKDKADTLAVEAPSDSLALTDSLAVQTPDTTRVGFLQGIHNIRIFRKDIQARADSLLYSDLDSIARFYVNPVIWNEGTRQYSADSIFALVRNKGMDRASLMSNAFIINQEDSLCFDQIKATEVMAYFDSTAALRRFDALGGASAYFYLEENGSLATMNKVDSKMLSALFIDGELDQVFYFDQPHNDAYPVAQLTAMDRVMRDFKWQKDRCPASREDITPLVLKPSERLKYLLRPKAVFDNTDIYFPGYISSVYRSLELRDSLKMARRQEAETVREDEVQPADTVQKAISPADTLSAAIPDAVADTLAKPAADSLVTASADTLSLQRNLSERERKKQEREEAREARWADLDARDAARAEARAQKALEKKRARTRRALEARKKQEARDAARVERFKARYAARKARQDRKTPKTK